MIKRILKKLYFVPRATINLSAKKNIKRVSEMMRNRKNIIILNLGCGERFIGGESLKEYFRLINLDIYKFPEVDIIADAHLLPFKDNSFDAIISQAVLEHTEDPWVVANEIYRILKNKGIVYVEVPFLQGFHPSPSDYYRFTIQGLEKLFSKFEKIDLNVCVGPSSTLSWILREYLTGVMSFFSGSKFLLSLGSFISGWITFPIKYLDFLFAKKSLSHKIASGLYFLGEKDEDR